jgi:demethylmenaquinone methyltransferase/2-methoxy-6-polyprenyl-1,4-benzoquinol methylase
MTTTLPPASAPTVRPHPVLPAYFQDERDRRRRVRVWFDEAAGHYDWVSQGLSFGSGHWYRRKVLREAGVTAGTRVLDVACGTGVLAHAAQELAGTAGRTVGLDPSAGMLGQARFRGVRHLCQGFAEALPYADESFDVLTMGYALRHVSDLVTTFREYRRVVRNGGKVLVLEITPPRSRVGTALLKAHMRYVVPLAARIGSRKRTVQEVFAYFWDTIETCVPPATILDAMREAGFTKAERRVELGIFSTYEAVR